MVDKDNVCNTSWECVNGGMYADTAINIVYQRCCIVSILHEIIHEMIQICAICFQCLGAQ